MSEAEFSIEEIDQYSSAIYLKLPESKVVLLQATFEMYEGIGVVRTLKREESYVCIFTTRDQVRDCQSLLSAMKGELEWVKAPKPDPALRDHYFTTFKA